MNPKPLRHVDLRSDAGRLEALYRDIPQPRGIAVVCHPHPEHGGTLHNKVVFRAARGLENADVATLRFNFRGAGASQGEYDEGEGEQRDVEAAIEWLIEQHEEDLPLFVGGFSFGSWVSSRVACDDERVRSIFLIGAPVNKYSMNYLRGCEKPKLVLQGSRDEFGGVDRLEEVASAWPRAEIVIVEGADHFFAGQVEFVEETMRRWVTEQLEGRG